MDETNKIEPIESAESVEPTLADELLQQPDVATEILPDLAAMTAAGLKTPEDA